LVQSGMPDTVRTHYEIYPYPHYPLLASVRRCDTYALNLTALWTRFNGCLPPSGRQRVLIAGCGSFSPYPFALANPDAKITALDLSSRSIGRARLHCLLHGRNNVTFRCGDLFDLSPADGMFELIDAYGVLHHLDDPLAGLKALAARLSEGGILRLMVYSRYARREEEAIRRAFRLLHISDPDTARKLMSRSRPGSRLRGFAETSDEVVSEAGLADALLHPCVQTMRIDGLMEMIRQSGLEPLLFAHHGALADVAREIERIRALEASMESPGNFVIYLGRNVAGPCSENKASSLLINPCLSGTVGPFRPGTVHVAPRLGFPNPPLGRSERSYLRRFCQTQSWNKLSKSFRSLLPVYRRALFLLQYRC
jgi:SAM-dependent methyltransferase